MEKFCRDSFATHIRKWIADGVSKQKKREVDPDLLEITEDIHDDLIEIFSFVGTHATKILNTNAQKGAVFYSKEGKDEATAWCGPDVRSRSLYVVYTEKHPDTDVSLYSYLMNDFADSESAKDVFLEVVGFSDEKREQFLASVEAANMNVYTTPLYCENNNSFGQTYIKHYDDEILVSPISSLSRFNGMRNISFLNAELYDEIQKDIKKSVTAIGKLPASERPAKFVELREKVFAHLEKEEYEHTARDVLHSDLHLLFDSLIEKSSDKKAITKNKDAILERINNEIRPYRSLFETFIVSSNSTNVAAGFGNRFYKLRASFPNRSASEEYSKGRSVERFVKDLVGILIPLTLRQTKKSEIFLRQFTKLF